MEEDGGGEGHAQPLAVQRAHPLPPNIHPVCCCCVFDLCVLTVFDVCLTCVFNLCVLHVCLTRVFYVLWQVLLCASMCGMADLCSECEYLLCLRISATAFNDKGLPVDDTDATFEKKFGTIPKGF